MKLVKIFIFFTIIIICLFLFKSTKKYKYQTILPGHIQELIPEFKPMFPYHPQTLHTMQNPEQYIQPTVTTANPNLMLNRKFVNYPKSKSTNRPAIKWIVKQDPMRQS